MHFQTAREQPRPSLSTELDDRPSGHMGRVDYPRQVVREPLHPQAMQTDKGKLRGETPALGDRQLIRSLSDRRRVVVGV